MSFEWKDWQYATLFIPLLTGAISVLYWYLSKKRITPSESNLYFSNGIIWVFLYILLGLAWSLSISYYNTEKDKDKQVDGILINSENTMIIVHILYTFLIIILAWWPHFSKDVKIYQTISLMLSFMCIAINPVMSNLCLAPFVAWIIIRPTHD